MTKTDDQTKRIKELEEKVKVNEERFDRLMNVLRYNAKDVQDLLAFGLEEAISLTKSEIGYIYHYSEDTKEFVLNTWSTSVMKQCTIQNPQSKYMLEKTGVWGEAVRQRKPIVLNDFKAPHPLKKGYPKGHAPLKKFMTIPVIVGEKIVAVVGVANKETDYTEEDIKQLTLLMAAIWEVVGLHESETALKEKAAELEKTNEFMIGRELKMAELKKEIEKYKGKSKEK